MCKRFVDATDLKVLFDHALEFFVELLEWWAGIAGFVGVAKELGNRASLRRGNVGDGLDTELAAFGDQVDAQRSL